MDKNRRDFLKSLTLAASAATLSPLAAVAAEPRFKISLAEWSIHKALQAKELDHLDWPKHTKDNFGITALEHVNQFFGDMHETLGLQPKGADYLNELKKRTADLGMTNVLIMCDRVGNLGDPDAAKRTAAVEGHYAWCDAAKLLGCHSIRVNARSDDKLPRDEQAKLCIDGLRRLSEHGATKGLNVIVENHGGLSSDGAWLAGVMKAVNLPNCGTLPDFGNFFLAKNRGDAAQYEKAKEPFKDGKYQESAEGLYYDRYQGIADLMPFAKGVSAKSHDFDAEGNETHTDFLKAMKVVKDAGYSGYVGIEYEGSAISEVEGIKKTKALLEKVFAQLA